MERQPTYSELIRAGCTPDEAKKIIEQRLMTIVTVVTVPETEGQEPDMEAAKLSLDEEDIAARAYKNRVKYVMDPDLKRIIQHNLDDELNDHAPHLAAWIREHGG